MSTLEEKRNLGSQGRAIYLLDPDRLMAEHASGWKKLSVTRIRFAEGQDIAIFSPSATRP